MVGRHYVRQCSCKYLTQLQEIVQCWPRSSLKYCMAAQPWLGGCDHTVVPPFICPFVCVCVCVCVHVWVYGCVGVCVGGREGGREGSESHFLWWLLETSHPAACRLFPSPTTVDLQPSSRVNHSAQVEQRGLAAGFALDQPKCTDQ